MNSETEKSDFKKYSNDIISKAKKYFGYPYDTSPDGWDGGAIFDWEKTGKTKILGNFSGEILETSKKPMVCADLIVNVLSDLGFGKILDFDNGKTFVDVRFESEVLENAWRFTDYLKEQIENKKEFFDIIDIDLSMKFFSEKKNLKKLPSFKVGDIVTVVSENGFRHIVFVSKVDKNNIPTKAIQTNFRGTGETSFFNTRVYGTDFKGSVRYNGIFRSENYILDKIIRPNKKALEKIYRK